MSILGADISSPVRFADLVARGAQFAYHQLTDGVGTPNRAAVADCNGLRAAGLSNLGGYLYLHARHGRAQDADEQVKEYLDLAANCGVTLPHWLDVESGEGNALATHDEVKAAVLGALDAFSRYAPDDSVWIYTSPGEAVSLGVSLIDEVKAYPLVVAAYVVPVGKDAPEPTKLPAIPAPWTSDDVVMHQWAGNVPAFGGMIDRVRCLLTLDQLRAA
jgi:hypothetical protein